MSNSENRVLNRKGARTLTPEEIELIKSGAGTNCTFRVTHAAFGTIDDLVDDCLNAES